jgi:hypothetical protein
MHVIRGGMVGCFAGADFDECMDAFVKGGKYINNIENKKKEVEL